MERDFPLSDDFHSDVRPRSRLGRFHQVSLTMTSSWLIDMTPLMTSSYSSFVTFRNIRTKNEFSFFFFQRSLFLEISSLAISVFLVIKHTYIPHIVVLGRTPQNKFRDIRNFPEAKLIPVKKKPKKEVLFFLIW